ncbi:hypothetical protein JJB07_04895 [Tumebacillus sp. ITR2]|uniref:Uncharacterized protein n=1 Tax=Tumebacillus amylolyticus TaxID=2801339 RepID=A0ABS1J6T5_9BACL|nr:hypothetical protein [Tumebacillus amylolyticus]MBL0385983.1 hypothetical protein [Tumebacillus amylolyticus]
MKRKYLFLPMMALLVLLVVVSFRLTDHRSEATEEQSTSYVLTQPIEAMMMDGSTVRVEKATLDSNGLTVFMDGSGKALSRKDFSIADLQGKTYSFDTEMVSNTNGHAWEGSFSSWREKMPLGSFVEISVGNQKIKLQLEKSSSGSINS